MATILIIEDDLRIQKTLSRLFLAENFEVRVLDDGTSAAAVAQEPDINAVVLDLMLPKISGREICRSLKAQQPNLPVVILSAVNEVADKVLLLELGADDYVTKPFSPRELLARVQAAIRRCGRMNLPTSLKEPASSGFGDVVVHFEQMTVSKAGVPVVLTTQEFKLLHYLLQHPLRVLSRQELLNDVWGYESYPTTRTVDNQVMKLRQKLEDDAAEPRFIRTIHGAGYKFTPGG